MFRIWDWIVGLAMIAVAIVAGGIVAALIALPVVWGLDYFIHVDRKYEGVTFWCAAVGVFAILQMAGFYDYYRRRRVKYAIGNAGLFHLAPRAIQRMRTGVELPGFVDEWSGKPTTIQAPINAGRRGVVALVVTAGSAAAVIFCAQAKGEWTLVVVGLGLIGVLVGLVLLAQVVLAYAGFIRRE